MNQTHTIISAEPKTDQLGNVEKTSNGAIKYRVTLEDGSIHTGYGDWITQSINIPNAVEVQPKQLPNGVKYSVVNRALNVTPRQMSEFKESIQGTPAAKAAIELDHAEDRRDQAVHDNSTPVDWDAKDRTSMYQTCVKAGTDIVVALMGASLDHGVIKDPVKTSLEYADKFYARMTEVRKGAK